MREIRFRIFDTELNKMIYEQEKIEIFDDMIGFRFKRHLEADIPIVMQYTGLYDRFGHKIYEADYVIGVNRITEEEIEQEVTFLNGCFMFGNWNAHEYFSKHTEIFVSGNKYESER